MRACASSRPFRDRGSPHLLPVELDDPVLGHELVLVRGRAEEVVRDVDAAARRLIAALEHCAVGLLRNQAARPPG